MEPTVTQCAAELADREAIRDCLYRYARGCDRCDEALLRSAYWEDATDHHLEFNGTIDEFIAYSLPRMRAMDQNIHLIGNIYIALDGPRALVESYMTGVHRVATDGTMQDIVALGRYLDRFERRSDRWRIARRTVIVDWFREYPDSADWAQGPFGMGEVPRGTAGFDDLSYTWLGLGRDPVSG